MSKNCNIGDHKKSCRDTVNSISKQIGAEYIEDGLHRILYDGSKNKTAAYDRAIHINRKIEREFGNKYGFHYEGSWTGMDQKKEEGKAIFLFSGFSKKLEGDYLLKGEEVLRGRRDRSDDMPSKKTPGVQNPPNNPDGYHFSNYIAELEHIRNNILQRKGVLDQMAEKTKQDLIQSEDLNKTLKVIKKDLAHLGKAEVTIENVFTYFNRDIEAVRDILLTNPTEENLILAGVIMESMEFVHSEEEGSFSENYFRDIENTDIRKEFLNTHTIYKDVAQMLTRAKEKLYNQMLEEYDTEIETKESYYVHPWKYQLSQDQKNAREAARAGRDITRTEEFFLPIDAGENMSNAGKMIRKVHDDRHAKRESDAIQRRLVNIKPALVKELRRLGYGNKLGVIGKLLPDATYDIFFKTDKAGNERLIGKFSNFWKESEDILEQEQKDILESSNDPAKSAAQKASTASKRRKKLFTTLKDRGGKFMNVMFLPEFMKDADLQADFPGAFTTDEVFAESYKESVIRKLSGGVNTPSSVKMATKEYEKLIVEQKEKMYQYKIARDSYIENQVRKEGVGDESSLSQLGQNKIAQFIAANDPIGFSNAYVKQGDSKVEKGYWDKNGIFQTNGWEHSSLTYSVMFPGTTKNFDENFAGEIEGNQALLNGWDVIRDAIEFINNNRKYTAVNSVDSFSDSLLFEYDFYMAHATVSWSSLDKQTIGRLRNVLSTGAFVDVERKVMRLHDQVNTINEVVFERVKLMKNTLKHLGVKPKDRIDPTNINPQALKSLKKWYGNKTLPLNKTVHEILTEIAKKQVLKSQKMDLIESLQSMTKVVETFKANKDVESKILFLRNSFEEFDTKGKRGSKQTRTRQLGLMNAWVNYHLYGVNNRDNWSGAEGKQITIPQAQRKELVNLAKEQIIVMEESIQQLGNLGLTPKQIEEAHTAILEDIEFAKETIESGGRVITVGSIVHTLFVTLPINVALGLSPVTQAVNYAIGRISGTVNNGLLYEEGAYRDAISYNRKFRVLLRFALGSLQPEWSPLMKNSIRKHNISNTFLNDIGMFQNSGNEIDNIVEHQTTKNFKKLIGYLREPLTIVGATEKTIQRPQMQAIMKKILVFDENGDHHPLFNPKTGEMVAFILVDGQLQLAEGFNTERNRRTWVDKNSQEFADIFGQSGIIPTLISIMNADYRTTSTTSIKATPVGVQLMIFKSWVPAMLMREYHRDYGIHSTTHLGGRGTTAIGIKSAARMMGAVSLGTLTGSLYLGIAGSVAYGAILAYQRKKKLGIDISLDTKELSKLYRIIRTSSNTFEKTFGVKFSEQVKELGILYHTITTTGKILAFLGKSTGSALLAQVAVLPKMVQMLTGNRIFSNHEIASLMFIEQKDGELKVNYELAKNSINAMLAKYALTIGSIGVAATTNYAFHKFMDKIFDYYDDEEEEYTKWTPEEEKKRQAQRALAEKLFYITRNLGTRTQKDIDPTADPFHTIKLIMEGNPNSAYDRSEKLIDALQDASEENYIYSSGIHKGKNKVRHSLKKFIFFNSLADMDWTAEDGWKMPTGTLGNISKKQFDTGSDIDNVFLTDKEIMTKEAARQKRVLEHIFMKVAKKEYQKKTGQTKDLSEFLEEARGIIKAMEKATTTDADKDNPFYHNYYKIPSISEKDFTQAGKFLPNIVKVKKDGSIKYDFGEITKYKRLTDSIPNFGNRLFMDNDPFQKIHDGALGIKPRPIPVAN